MFTICVGNPVDGFSFYGVFNDHESAIEYAENEMSDAWYIVTINPVKES